MSSMEGNAIAGARLWLLITAVAPVAWGANYYVTHEFLPADHALYGSAFRALPAGLLLLVLVRRLPRGAWWWRSALLGVLNMGGFFALVYVAAQRLPTSVAATVMATAPLVMTLFAWGPGALWGSLAATTLLAAVVIRRWAPDDQAEAETERHAQGSVRHA